ncbi:uncharacterized protein [Diadema antillarum]|uniref:uncharacterized protein n=1 Tax=Diadema antillarum TaxID=105358 RepID=UPI003A8C5965
MDDAATQSLKQSWSAHQGWLSRLYKELEVLMADFGNKDAVNEKYQKLIGVFVQYEEKYRQYHSTLSGAEAEAAEAKFNASVNNKEEFNTRLQGWLEKAAGHRSADKDDDRASVHSSATSVRSSTSSSIRSSKRSNSSSSSARLREARAKAAVARLKREQLQRAQQLREQELKLQQEIAAMEADNEIEAAEVELQILEEESDDDAPQVDSVQFKYDMSHSSPVREVKVGQSGGHDVKRETVSHDRETSNPENANKVRDSSDLNPSAPEWFQKERNDDVTGAGIAPVNQMFQAIDLALNMPKPEIAVFDGNPLEYWGFINQFETTVASKTSDERVKLTYLIQYCRGKAKESIENCTFLDKEGYQKAREILADQFGQSYQVSHAHMKKVLSRQQIRPNDGDALWDLARDMKRCHMVLSQRGYGADMNSSDNLLSIQQLLPLHLQAEWAKRAHSMMCKGVVPNFEVMTAFVEESAKLATNMFGQNIGKALKPNANIKSPKPKASNEMMSFATQGSGSKFTPPSSASSEKKFERKCQCCQGSHDILFCPVFKKKSFEERKAFTRQAKLCDNCMQPMHMAVGCLAKPACQIKGCRKRHISLLHPPDREMRQSQANRQNVIEPQNAAHANQGVQNQDGPVATDEVGNRGGQTYSAHAFRQNVRLRVVPVRVEGNGRSATTWALLDEGSDVTLCSKGLADELGLAGKEVDFQLTTVNQQASSKKGMEVSLSVNGVDEDDVINLPHVWTVDCLPISTSSFPCSQDVKQWPHLEDLHLPSIERKQVQILIGADTPEAFWVLEQRRGERKEPYAVRTPLGWTLFGPTSSQQRSQHVSVNFTQLQPDPLQNQLKQFWEADHGAYLLDNKVGDSVEDKRALSMMQNSAMLSDGHYEIGLPWRSCPPSLPNNRGLAEARLRYLKRKLERDDVLREKYTSTMSEYIDKGYAEIVETEATSPESEVEAEDVVWYLPHHPVFHPHKPGKARVVFDCAAQFGGTSLNEQLVQGPDLTNNLAGVLMRFRQDHVAVMGDIESMFHQGNALQFLWWTDGYLRQDPQEYRMTVHTFGATSSPSCAGFALRKTAADNKGDYNEEVINTVQRNFYVDDCLKSVNSKEAAVSLVQGLRSLLAKGVFHLRKWINNDRDVLTTIPEADRAASVLSLDLEEMPVERTLGILWDVQTDSFKFEVQVKDKPVTRRGILSVASSLYDPLGFLAPFVLPAKILLQNLCRRDLSWDAKVSQEEGEQWREWLSDLPLLTQVHIRRCLKPEGFQEIDSAQLHHFCDASEVGYAAVSYLRLTGKSGEVHCAFVLGKARLAPMKVVSIPRLELMAAVLAVTMDQCIKGELEIKIDETVFWTDSTAVLQYIRSESRRFKTFVANRVAQIHNASTPKQWRHVDTKSNPADDGSRGLRASELLSNQRWITGPDFLKKEEKFWPAPPKVLELARDDSEVKKEIFVFATSLRGTMQDLLGRYSSWNKLKRVVTWLLRYKRWLLAKAKGEQIGELRSSLSAKELMQSEEEVIKIVQRGAFGDNLDGEELKGCALKKLNPVVVNGILRIGGRLGNSPLDYDAKHPIILPHEHHVTRLLITHHHHLVGHSGSGLTWSSLRTKYWVMKGGVAVRKVVGKCFRCKRRNAPRAEQMMAELPSHRVTPDKPPFSYVGVDYFGPILVKQGRSRVKRYGCLFTCMNSRAVHIEVAHSLDTDSFINALRRFIARRGKPERIVSDNGTNFRGAERELRESLQALNQFKVNNYLLDQGISWTFNTPTASHMGGVWERMVRSIRKILGSLLGQQTVNDEVLSTVLVEVEGILNSRPLTQLSMDPQDNEPLTPNHLLLMRQSPSLSPGKFDKDDCYGRRRWKQVQYLASVFWRRWQAEYLPLLQGRQKWLTPRRNLAINDLVLVGDDHAPRGQWPLGKVVEVYPGKDGLVRQVEIKVGSRFLKRPISKLCLLEAVDGK